MEGSEGREALERMTSELVIIAIGVQNGIGGMAPVARRQSLQWSIQENGRWVGSLSAECGWRGLFSIGGMPIL